MTEYLVEATHTYYETYIVEAESEDEARREVESGECDAETRVDEGVVSVNHIRAHS